MKYILCMMFVAILITGCSDVLINSAGHMGVLLWAPRQTYQLTLDGMTLPSEQLEGRTFSESLKFNIFVNDIIGNEKLTRLYGGELDSSNTNNVKAALSESLRIAGLLNEDPKAARYKLTTTVSENKLRGVINITVKTGMQFNLKDAVSGETLFQELIETPCTFSEHILYKVRIGKAMECSVRNNFTVLLDRLERLSIN